ncbi:MAG: DNA mismatch repair protein MutS [Bacteroidales bacterium]|nr:DNA mismatch repair protein MutS [Bacteroidales bacterium]
MEIMADTPLMKQYFSIKAKYPDTVLLYRVGDFYETYADDALIASKVLGIIQTKKSHGASGEVPLAGFPHHAIDVYLPKLVRAGYKVAVCDQLEDPKLTRKIVKRGVTEIVTPGVAFADQLLEQKEHNYLAGLAFNKDRCGAAFLDVSTGTFQIAEGSVDYISSLVNSFDPKELLVPTGYEKGVKERFGDSFYVSSIDEWAFVYESSVIRLQTQLHVDSLKGFGIDIYPLGVAAAGAVLVYVERTQSHEMKQICSISRIDADSFVWMDKFTVRNLEIFQSAGGREGVPLVDVLDKCSSPMGARLLRQWLSLPVRDIDELNSRYDVVEYFTKPDSGLDKLQECIGEMGDVERITSRAAAGKISPREVLQLARSLELTGPIMRLCQGHGVDALENMTQSISGCSDLLQKIRATLKSDCAAAIGKGEVIAAGVSAELDDLRNLSTNSKEYLLAMQQREIERTGITSLKISYNNVFGYYIEVRNAYKDRVPEEWVRKQTLVNAERYITEELKEYEAKILGAEERIYTLESELYAALVADIQNYIPAIQRNSRVIARLDTLAGFAENALERRYCRPEMTQGYEIDIHLGRHPVIETLMPVGEEYVPNDIYLDNTTQQIIILTGPNMSGKSALLRQTALIVLMAQIGSFVPAASAKLGWCDKIFSRVGDSDNISRGESSFMVEMLESSMILHNLSSRSLVLMDEIGRGTSTYDGMSIAGAIVEYIHDYGRGAKTLFATHYHELNELEKSYDRIHNYHVAVKEVGNNVIFLHKLKEGGVAHSFGIHVARMAGMPQEVIESAEKTLKALEDSTGKGPQKTIKPHNTKAGRVESDGSLQLSFFQLDDPLLETLREDLKAVDLNNLTPLQAFDLLRSMKEKLGL